MLGSHREAICVDEHFYGKVRLRLITYIGEVLFVDVANFEMSPIPQAEPSLSI